MKRESQDIQDDKFAAIGIGAMIVFIALILVAAVAAAVIIQTAEKLQQNAQTTGEDTSKNLAGKLLINAGFVATGAPGAPANYDAEDAYTLYVRLAPGSKPVKINEISFQIMRDSGIIEGIFSIGQAGDIALLDQGDGAVLGGTTELQPGQPYVLWIDADQDGIDCSANNLNAANVRDTTIQLYIHVGTGGTTYEVLTLGSDVAGSEVI